MLPVSKTLESVSHRLKAAGIESYHLDSRILVSHTIGILPEKLLGKHDLLVSDEGANVLEGLVLRRLEREPVSKIIGYREFWSLNFDVTRHTLDPRPATETLVQASLDHLMCARNLAPLVLDLGTGSGCVLISILKECEGALGVGVDLSLDALQIAAGNAKKHGVENRCGFVAGNWGEAMGVKFDIIVSNPPYIACQEMLVLEAEVANYDPRLALFGGRDGLDSYRSIALDLRRLLREDGILVLEIGAYQRESVTEILQSTDFMVLNAIPDIEGLDRCLTLKAGPKKNN